MTIEEPVTTDIVVSPLPSTLSMDVEPITYKREPLVHGIIGAQFGDLEFDMGRSAKWLEHFTDDMFFSDVFMGEQRYWVINWTESFPRSKYTTTNINFFHSPENAARFRQEQFAQASKAWNYEPKDWVIWIDGHEGLSVDNTSLPDDFQFAPFQSYIYRETARAEDADHDRVTLPFFVYTHYSDLQNITYDGDPYLDHKLTQAVAVPWYIPNLGLLRLMKVSVLQDPNFDWTLIDTPKAVSPDVKIQVVSYGYFHWNIQDIQPGQTEVPDLDANNDLGWQQRKKLSKVRPIFGLPFDEPWKDPDEDIPGLPGPWCVDMISVNHPDFEYEQEFPHTPPAAECARVRTPLYHKVPRLNLRDGLFWREGTNGNIPLTWDSENGKWIPTYSPEEWPQFGTEATPL